MEHLGPQLLSILEIIWINIILSGDNAVVIALACRGLPKRQRKWGMILGAGAAVVLRIAFTVIIVELLATPYLKIVGGLLLVWIAVKLVTDEAGDDESKIRTSDKLLAAVWTVTVADAVMSLDNVIAIAAVAKGDIALMVFGLAISIPLIVAGAGLILKVLDRLPALVWAGAALLGWVAGEMVMSDPALLERVGAGRAHALEVYAAAATAALVLAIAFAIMRLRGRSLTQV